MSRLSGGKLTNLRCRTASVGTIGDGGGLYLQVRAGANGLTRSWVYRYTANGKQVWLGLGPFPVVTLAAAREKALDARRLRLEGEDPLAANHAVRAALRQRAVEEKAKSMTFAQCADGYFTAQRKAWTPKHAKEWLRVMAIYVLPTLGPSPLARSTPPP
jgi:Arm DNA-binding domain